MGWITWFLNVEMWIQVLATSSGNTRNNKELDDDPTSGHEGDKSYGNDDENMVSSSQSSPGANIARDKHLRYRTRVFAAEYVNLILLLSMTNLYLCFHLFFCMSMQH